MPAEMLEQRLLVLREPEEIVLLLDPLRLRLRMLRATAVHELFLRLECLASDAVPPFVHPFVNVPCIVNALHQFRDRGLMPRLCRPDEVAIGKIEGTPRALEDLLHSIAVCQRIEALLRGALVDGLRVL